MTPSTAVFQSFPSAGPLTTSATAPRFAADPASGSELGGLTGTVLDVVERLGAIGVGLLTFAETIVPPLPSEVILPVAGYLAERGRMGLVAVLVAATLGALAGAWLLYLAGARFGRERAAAQLSRLPLVEREDVEAAIRWFDRHGPWAVFLGRLVPGVRSLISLPAGASALPFVRFTVLTALGSLLWNAVLVGAGYALGTQWRTVEQYSGVLDAVVYTAAGGTLLLLVARRLRRRRQRQPAAALTSSRQASQSRVTDRS